MNIHSFSGSLPEIAKAWSALQTQAFLKPIRNDDDYQSMVRLAEMLADNLEGEEGPISDIFGVVTDLIEIWETHHVAIPKAEPKEVLRYLLESHDLKQKDLADIASPTMISDILAGRRAISKTVAKALSERFNTDISVFI